MSRQWKINPGARLPSAEGLEDPVKVALSKVNLFVLCERIYKLRKQGKYYFSPVRDDGLNAAFEIREDGQVAIDHGTGIGFNAITLIENAEGLSRAEAKERLIYYAQNLGDSEHSCRNPQPDRDQVPRELVSYEWPFLGIGGSDDYRTFASLRGLEIMSLIEATALDLLFFFQDRKTGKQLCSITDKARHVRQDRCVDGTKVPLAGGGSTKSRTIGTASWPVGAANIREMPVVLMVEGMPDLLAAVQVIVTSGRVQDTAAVAMLGAGQRIHPKALPLFAGKCVRIFPDEDDAGLSAAEGWQQQLRQAEATVDICRLNDLALKAGKGSTKDLNDFLVKNQGRINPGILIPHHVNLGGKNANRI